MTGEGNDVELSQQDLRVVARFAAECAREALAIFESDRPDDTRPREAIAAALAFADGAPRTNLQRTTAAAAHRAGREATTAAARSAAVAAGDAAASAYLHPLARATQVRHILGAAVHAACAGELDAAGDRSVGAAWIERSRARATPALVDVLRRYPAAPSSRTRVGELMRSLDRALRTGPDGRARR